MPDHQLPAPIAASTSTVTLSATNEAAVTASRSAATRRAYRSDFGIFSAWCEERGSCHCRRRRWLVVAAFLADQAEADVRPSTLSRRIATIAYAHDLAGLASPATL